MLASAIRYCRLEILLISALGAFPHAVHGADPVEVVGAVDVQPLAANVERIVTALEALGNPLPDSIQSQLKSAARETSSIPLQKILDEHVLIVVHINPEYRVKVARGPARANLVQTQHRPVLIKVLNEAAVTHRLGISSPQAGPVYAGGAALSLERQQQTELNQNENTANTPGRIFDVDMASASPLTTHLSGLAVEYSLALISCLEAGPREATLAFDVGQGTQDIGFRGELPVLFQVEPAIPVKLSILDHDGQPSVARLEIRDQHGHVHPAQSKRLAPDFFFQPHIYRRHGDTLLLAPGEYKVQYCRGPEYFLESKTLSVPVRGQTKLEVQLRRWVDPLHSGFASGDHHIHGAGCSHYTVPTEGVAPADMFLQVKGEGLNVGCVLTWGPCYDFQRQYFSPLADRVSEPLTVLKYDLEISGFGSAALGHTCLLNLKNQTYPGSDGTKVRGWPTWTIPALRWAKEQGGVTGYPHSDMQVDPAAYAQRLLKLRDTNGDALLSGDESRAGLLPEPFVEIDTDRNGQTTLAELTASAERASHQLPNLVLPAMRGSGAMEVFVSTAEGVCDFTSAMDTGRVGELNTWYHIMNCGFPLKLSGETDFPCMSSRRVGQGRVYVKMSDTAPDAVDFSDWCAGLAAGRSYVSDGFAHALNFTVNGVSPGNADIQMPQPGTVRIEANVAFAPQTPEGVAHGTQNAPEGRRDSGDTRILHLPRSNNWVTGGERLVEIVCNGEVVGKQVVPADGQQHRLQFEVPVARSSWIALRQFPQLHTNPVNVLIASKPIRASAQSGDWCADAIELLWENRSRLIAEAERPAALDAYTRAAAEYRQRAREAQ